MTDCCVYSITANRAHQPVQLLVDHLNGDIWGMICLMLYKQIIII